MPTLLWMVVLLPQQCTSFLVSVCAACASTNCCSTTLFSSNFSMNIKSTNFVLGHVCAFACQCLLLMCKNSTSDVPIWSISWIIICANCIFSLYTFLFAHSEDDEECNDDHTTNNWIFSTPCSVLHNSSLISFFLNNSTSSSCLRLCSLFYVSFPFVIVCSFLIALSTLMFLWSLELQKFSQLLAINENNFQWLHLFFCPWASHLSHSFFYLLAVF